MASNSEMDQLKALKAAGHLGRGRGGVRPIRKRQISLGKFPGNKAVVSRNKSPEINL